MIDYDHFHKVGYGGYKLEELLSAEDIAEFNKLADMTREYPINDETYQYTMSVVGFHNDPNWPFKVPASEREPRLQKIKELGLHVSQRWYDSAADPDSLKDKFRQIVNKFIRNFYPEINETLSNVYHQDAVTIYTNGDHTEIHRDGQNRGRMCAVLMYLTPEEEYNNSGDLVIIGDEHTSNNEYNLIVKPVRGHVAILDFNNHNAFHGVLPVDPDFKRHCYLTFVWNLDTMPEEIRPKDNMKNSKILITGGSGLVGQNLTNKLVADGYTNIRVHIHSRQPRIKHDAVEYVSGNLTTYEDCLAVTKDCNIVIHAAASTSNAVDTVQDPLAHVTPNVAMNNFLIDSAYRNKVKKYIFISSNTVYPPKGDDPVVETDFLFDEPYPVYFPVGWMKRYAEVQCELYAKYLPNPMTTVVIRPANLYGPHDKYDFAKCHVTPATIRKVADNMNPIPVWGDGTELRDLLYIDDFVEALQLVIEKQETYDVFNVGCNNVYSVNDVLSIMQGLVNNTNPIEYVKGKPSMIPTRRIDSNKIKDVLGWQATTPLEVGLLSAYQWYLDNKEEFK